MQIKFSFSPVLFSAALIVGAPLFAQTKGEQVAPTSQAAVATGKLLPVTEKDAAWAAKARRSYPLGVCVTSDEKLGSMGKSPEYIYRVVGQRDRLVIFCCGGCEEDFMQDPAKYLAKLDRAAKEKNQTADRSGEASLRGDRERK